MEIETEDLVIAVPGAKFVEQAAKPKKRKQRGGRMQPKQAPEPNNKSFPFMELPYGMSSSYPSLHDC